MNETAAMLKNTRPSQSLQVNTLVTIITLIPSATTTTAVYNDLRAASMTEKSASPKTTFTTESEPRNVWTTNTVWVTSMSGSPWHQRNAISLRSLRRPCIQDVMAKLVIKRSHGCSQIRLHRPSKRPSKRPSQRSSQRPSQRPS
jgi:hypothetical protein